jgi:hypothetical protein
LSTQSITAINEPMTGPPQDEFAERARLAAENQEIARDYLRQLGCRARVAFLIGLAGVLAMWLIWTLYRPPTQAAPQAPQVIIVR